jgi:hypothetical protein
VTGTGLSPVPPANRAPSARPPAGAVAAPCQVRVRTVCATASSNGRTIAAGVGWTIEVDLNASSSIWSTPVEAGEHLLRQLAGVRRTGGGVSAAYRTVAAGKTELRAFERPLCRLGRACPQLILVWELHVRVSTSVP